MGGFEAYWVLEVADSGPLPLLVGMGDPWISGLPCVCWLWPLVGVGTLYGMRSGVPLCLALVGLPLAMVGVGGQMGASGAGGPLCICGDGVLVLVWLCCLVGTGVS